MNVQLKGSRISDMEKAECILSNSLFLVSKIMSFRQEDIIDTLKDVAISYGLEYSYLSNQMLKDVSAAISVNTMAYHDKYEYAKINHNHTYHNIRAEAYYGPSSKDYKLSDEYWHLGTIWTKTAGKENDISVCMKPYDYSKFNDKIKYKIGEIKFVSTFLLTQEYMARVGLTENFGWVLADGKTYQKSDHEEAYQIYKTSSSTEFQVPNLQSFFKLNPGIYDKDSLKFTKERSGDIPHQHNIIKDKKLDTVDISANFNFPTTWTAQNCFSAHCGGSKLYPLGEGARAEGKYSFTEENKLKGVGLETYDNQEESGEKTPCYNLVAAFIYIGEKK